MPTIVNRDSLSTEDLASLGMREEGRSKMDVSLAGDLASFELGVSSRASVGARLAAGNAAMVGDSADTVPTSERKYEGS